MMNENQNAWTPTPDPSPQGGGERGPLRLLARDSYASSLQHAAVLAVVVITALIAIVPFVFAIIHAAP
jgi:hypothetical protein